MKVFLPSILVKKPNKKSYASWSSCFPICFTKLSFSFFSGAWNCCILFLLHCAKSYAKEKGAAEAPAPASETAVDSSSKAQAEKIPEKLPLVRMFAENKVYKRYMGQTFERLASSSSASSSSEHMWQVRTLSGVTPLNIPRELLEEVAEGQLSKPKALKTLMLAKGQGFVTFRWMIGELGISDPREMEIIRANEDKQKDTCETHLQVYAVLLKWTYQESKFEEKVCIFPVQLTNAVLTNVSEMVNGEQLDDEQQLILGKQLRYIRGMVQQVPLKIFHIPGESPRHWTQLTLSRGSVRYYDSLKRDHVACRLNAARMLQIAAGAQALSVPTRHNSATQGLDLDCGLYVCHWTEDEVRHEMGEGFGTQGYPDTMRLSAIKTKLYNTTNALENQRLKWAAEVGDKEEKERKAKADAEKKIEERRQRVKAAEAAAARSAALARQDLEHEGEGKVPQNPLFEQIVEVHEKEKALKKELRKAAAAKATAAMKAEGAKAVEKTSGEAEAAKEAEEAKGAKADEKTSGEAEAAKEAEEAKGAKAVEKTSGEAEAAKEAEEAKGAKGDEKTSGEAEAAMEVEEAKGSKGDEKTSGEAEAAMEVEEAKGSKGDEETSGEAEAAMEAEEAKGSKGDEKTSGEAEAAKDPEPEDKEVLENVFRALLKQLQDEEKEKRAILNTDEMFKQLSPEHQATCQHIRNTKFGICSRCRYSSGCLSCDYDKAVNYYFSQPGAKAKAKPKAKTKK
jgi:hypothetical protein